MGDCCPAILKTKDMALKKIKEGNDFILNWTIMQDDTTPIDTGGIYDEKLFLFHYGRRVQIPSFQRTANTIRIEVTPVMAPIIGTYVLEYECKKPDTSFQRGYRNRAFDTYAFKIVPCSSQDDDLRVIEVTTILSNSE